MNFNILSKKPTYISEVRPVHTACNTTNLKQIPIAKLCKIIDTYLAQLKEKGILYDYPPNLPKV